MNAKIGRKLEMGRIALRFCRENPVPSEGYAAAVARLEDRLARGKELALEQLAGMREVRSAAAWKRELRRTIRRTHLAHLTQIARMSEVDLPELRGRFGLRRGTIPYGEFRAAARLMEEQAQKWKEMMVPHGLSDSVIDSLAQLLNQLDQATASVIRGHLTHVGASAELELVAREVVQLVKALDGPIRLHFARNADLLASWHSASRVWGPRAGHEDRPAA